MRNINEYPITYEDAFSVISILRESAIVEIRNNKIIGDIRPQVLNWIEKQLKLLELHDKILDEPSTYAHNGISQV